MKVSRLSRLPVSLWPNSTSVWSTPSIGRSVGILLPMRRAKVGKNSMVENIAYELVPGLTLPGQRTKQKVRIEPSVASPSSPAEGTGVAHVRCSLVAHLACSLALRPVVRGEDDKSVVVDAELLQCVEDLADVVIALHQLVAVLTDARLGLELLGREIRKMPHRERQIEEEGPAGRLLPLHEVDRLRHQFIVDLGPDFPRERLDGP